MRTGPGSAGDGCSGPVKKVISDSCSLRNCNKLIFCRHGPEDWVRLSGGDYRYFVLRVVNLW